MPASRRTRRVDALDDIAARVTEHHAAAPAAVVATTREASDIFVGCAGRLSPDDGAATPDTIFDLASITKSYTAVLAARLARTGRLSLATAIGELVEETRETPLATTPIERLLAHRAGLLAHIQVFLPLLFGKTLDRSASLREVALSRRPECVGEAPADGFPPLYSDLGYLLVGEALERHEGLPLASLVEREITTFTGSEVVPGERLVDLANVAPTEEAAFRGGVVRGLVHDENAWAMGGGAMCGHAGLFGTAVDVARFGAALLEALAGQRDDWLSPDDLAPLVRERPGGTLRAGFDGKTVGASSSGALFGPRTFGHLGFTGTSLWMDPDTQISTVLLTNRVFPTREGTAIRAARPDVYDRTFSWWSFVRESLQSEAP